MSHLRGMTWDQPRGWAPLVGLGGHSGPRGHTTVEWSARSLQAFADHPLEDLAASFDLMVIDHPHVPLAAGKGLLVALDEHDDDQSLSTLARQSVGPSFLSYAHAEHVWAVPIDAAAQVAVCRPDLIAEPPEEWDDVLDLARDGRVLWPTKPVDAMSSFLTLVAQQGGRVCTTPDRFVDRDLGLAVLDFMGALSDLVDPVCRAENPVETAERLASEDRWCYAPLAYGYVNYSRKGFRRRRLAYRNIPRGRQGVTGSCLGGAGIAVSALSKHRREAVEVALWLASAELQSGEYYHLGGQPANAVAWEDPEINANCLEFFTGTRATLENASVRPRDPGWLVLQELLGDLVHETLVHRLGAEESLNRLDAAWQKASSTTKGQI